MKHKYCMTVFILILMVFCSQAVYSSQKSKIQKNIFREDVFDQVIEKNNPVFKNQVLLNFLLNNRRKKSSVHIENLFTFQWQKKFKDLKRAPANSKKLAKLRKEFSEKVQSPLGNISYEVNENRENLNTKTINRIWDNVGIIRSLIDDHMQLITVEEYNKELKQAEGPAMEKQRRSKRHFSYKIQVLLLGNLSALLFSLLLGGGIHISLRGLNLLLTRYFDRKLEAPGYIHLQIATTAITLITINSLYFLPG